MVLKRLAQHEIKLTLKRTVSAFQSYFRVFHTLKNTAARTCEIKHCRLCLHEITAILVQFYFMLCEPLIPVPYGPSALLYLKLILKSLLSLVDCTCMCVVLRSLCVVLFLCAS